MAAEELRPHSTLLVEVVLKVRLMEEVHTEEMEVVGTQEVAAEEVLVDLLLSEY